MDNIRANTTSVWSPKQEPGYDKPKISEPSVMGRVNEILNHLQTASIHVSNLRSGLFGEGQSKDVGENVPTNLDSMLALACHQIASLCGELATIESKLDTDTPTTSRW